MPGKIAGTGFILSSCMISTSVLSLLRLTGVMRSIPNGRRGVFILDFSNLIGYNQNVDIFNGGKNHVDWYRLRRYEK